MQEHVAKHREKSRNTCIKFSQFVYYTIKFGGHIVNPFANFPSFFFGASDPQVRKSQNLTFCVPDVPPSFCGFVNLWICKNTAPAADGVFREKYSPCVIIHSVMSNTTFPSCCCWRYNRRWRWGRSGVNHVELSGVIWRIAVFGVRSDAVTAAAMGRPAEHDRVGGGFILWEES
jgi:hypothetical protein